MKLHSLILKHRKALGLTGHEYGQRYNVSPAAVSNWERGKDKPPARVIFDVIADLDFAKIIKNDEPFGGYMDELIFEYGKQHGMDATKYRDLKNALAKMAVFVLKNIEY